MSTPAPLTEDARPPLGELEELISELTASSKRCFETAAKLAKWATLCNVLLVVVGALVAACGGLSDSLGSQVWLAVSLILLGALTSLGGAYQGICKPRERSPKLAELGLEYQSLARRAKERSFELQREPPQGEPASALGRLESMALLVSRISIEREDLQVRESDLYVVGPPKLGRSSPASPAEGPATAPQ